MAGVLYSIATPLGNLGDIGGRVAATFEMVSTIYAEDTRHSRVLLDHLGIQRPLRSLHQHNEQKRREEVLALLARGENIALISDAGTPGVSDPGSWVIGEALREGYRVSPIPGPSALAAALSVCGFSQGQSDIWFIGFLPLKKKLRNAMVARIEAHPGLVVFFEGPHRGASTLAELAERMPEREISVCRELTKIHEEVLRFTLEEAASWGQQGIKGELTMVLGPGRPIDETPTGEGVDEALRRCLGQGMSNRDAASAVATVLGLRRKEVYRRCLDLHPAKEKSAQPTDE